MLFRTSESFCSKVLITSWQWLKARLGKEQIDVDDLYIDEPEAGYASSRNMQEHWDWIIVLPCKLYRVFLLFHRPWATDKHLMTTLSILGGAVAFSSFSFFFKVEAKYLACLSVMEIDPHGWKGSKDIDVSYDLM